MIYDGLDKCITIHNKLTLVKPKKGQHLNTNFEQIDISI